MGFALTKQRVLGIVGAGLLSLGLAIPAMAANSSGTVTVSGVNKTHLTFTINDTNAADSTASVGFGDIDPNGLGTGTPNTNGACFAAANSVAFKVKSNLPYSGTVGATAETGDDYSDVPVSQLYWSDTTANCASTAFSASGQWFTERSPNGNDAFSNTYALQVNWANTPGDVDMTLTYAVSQAAGV